MNRALFYTVVLGFVSGVFLRSFCYLSFEATLLGLVIGVGLSAWWWRSSLNASLTYDLGRNFLLLGIIFVTTFSLGALRFSWAEDSYEHSSLVPLTNQTVTLYGRVIREPDTRATTKLLTIETESGGRFLFITDRFLEIKYGDEVACQGVLKSPEAFLTDLGRSFDYRGYLLARGITHTMSFGEIEVLSRSSVRHPLVLLYEAKSYFIHRLSLVINEPALGLGTGLLLGLKSSLGKDLEEAFRQSGIVHIVVLSGYNIMLIVTFVMYVLAFVLPYRSRLVVGMVAVGVFALLVGYSPSVARASLMAIVFLLMSLLARPYLIFRALLLAVIVMLLINPYTLVFDVGFQLSALATLGLIFVAPSIEKLTKQAGVRESIRTFIVATIATQIAVLPLILYQIGEWSLISVPINLLVLPMVPVAMLLTFLTGIVALLSITLAMPIAFLAEWSLMYIITVAEVGSSLPFATVTIPPFSGFWVFLLYGLMGGVWYWFYRRRQREKLTVEDKTGIESAVESVSNWTIVEENELLQEVKQEDNLDENIQKKTETTSVGPSSSSQIPVFFR